MEGLVIEGGSQRMKILITGNLGYVGPWVTRGLRAANPTAILAGFDTGYFAHCFTSAAHLPEALLDVQFFGDIRQFPSHALSGVDTIVHLAAISNDPMGKAYEELTFDVNYRAGVELAKQAKAAGVRSFVFASSCSVYGFAEDGPRSEQSSVRPLTAYAKSKVPHGGGARESGQQGISSVVPAVCDRVRDERSAPVGSGLERFRRVRRVDAQHSDPQ